MSDVLSALVIATEVGHLSTQNKDMSGRPDDIKSVAEATTENIKNVAKSTTEGIKNVADKSITTMKDAADCLKPSATATGNLVQIKHKGPSFLQVCNSIYVCNPPVHVFLCDHYRSFGQGRI